MQKKKIYLVNNLIRQVLERKKEDNFFVDEKFITREDLFNSLTYQGNIDTIMYLKNHYNYSYEKAEETLENFLFIKEGVSKKVDRIYSIFKDLLDHNLLTINKEYLRLFKDSVLLIPNYLKDDVELLHLLDLYSLDYEFYDLNIDNHLSSIKEFNNVDEEIIYLLQEIRKLLAQGVKLNQIKVIASKDYYLHLYVENQFSPIKFSKDKYFSYLNHHDFKLFMDNLNPDDVEQNALSILPKIKNLSLFKNLLDQYILDKDSLPKDEIKPYFIYKAKKMHYDFIFDNSIMVTSIDNVNVDDYVFILDFNQDNYPSAYKDDDLFSSSEKDALFRNNYLNLSKLSEEELKTNLSLIKHLYISYNKPQQEIIVSSLKDSLNLDVVSYSQDNKLHSNHLLSQEKKNNFIGKRLDEFNSFGFSSPYIGDFVKKDDANCITDVNYKTYSNKYTFVKTDYKLDKISYSSINEYFKCQFKYYLKYVLKIDEFEDNIYSTRGKVFHRELELLAKDISFDYKNYFSSSDIASFQLDNKAKIFLSRDQDIIFNDILDIQKNIFQETELDSLCPEISSLQYDIDGVKLNGRVDLVMKNETKYVLIDYKTGDDKFNKDDIQYGFSMQLIIYYLLMSYNYPSLEPLGIFIENIYDKDYISTIKNVFNGISFADLEPFSKTYASYKPKMIKDENLSKDEFDQLVELGKTKIEEMIEGVKNNAFPIQPKKTYSSKGTLSDRSCSRCSYRDICYRKDEDYIILPKSENNENNNVED